MRALVFYAGTVAANLDPKFLGRLRIRAQIFGGGEGAKEWVPSFLGAHGVFPRLPNEGAAVRLLLEDGDPNRPWWLPMNLNERGSCPEVLRPVYPKVGWLRTPDGGTLAFSDHTGYGGPFVWAKNSKGFGMVARGEAVFLGNAANPFNAVQGVTHAKAAYYEGGSAKPSTSVFISR